MGLERINDNNCNKNFRYISGRMAVVLRGGKRMWKSIETFLVFSKDEILTRQCHSEHSNFPFCSEPNLRLLKICSNLLYLCPECCRSFSIYVLNRGRGDYYPKFVFKTYKEQLQDANRAMIIENVWYQTANQKKAMKVRIISGRK